MYIITLLPNFSNYLHLWLYKEVTEGADVTEGEEGTEGAEAEGLTRNLCFFCNL